MRAFILEHTALTRAPLIPELSLHLATESTALWRATEAWLEEAGIAPPYWAFAWAGGQALARLILDRSEWVEGRSVVDFGAGSGLVGLAAKRAGAANVVALDRDPLALVATVMNAEANGLSVETRIAERLADAPASELVLAGDVFYERSDAATIVEELRTIAASGRTVFAGCPGRTFTPTDVEVIAEVEVTGVLELEGQDRKITKVLRFS